MRIWSVHPKYLDRAGLLAVWREGLLAQAVLLDRTKGYRSHPQLVRFKQQPNPPDAIASYLSIIAEEAAIRGYSFDVTKVSSRASMIVMPVTTGQVDYEWQHLLSKLVLRDPVKHEMYKDITTPDLHPLFLPTLGLVEAWEKVVPKAKAL